MNLDFISQMGEQYEEKSKKTASNREFHNFNYLGLATVELLRINPNADDYKSLTYFTLKPTEFHSNPYIKEVNVDKAKGLKETFFVFTPIVRFSPKEEYNRITRPPMEDEDKLPKQVTKAIEIVFNTKLGITKFGDNNIQIMICDKYGKVIKAKITPGQENALVDLNKRFYTYMNRETGKCEDVTLREDITRVLKTLDYGETKTETFHFESAYMMRKGEKDLLDFVFSLSKMAMPSIRTEEAYNKTRDTYNKTKPGSGDLWYEKEKRMAAQFDYDFWRNKFNVMLLKASSSVANKNSIVNFTEDFEKMILGRNEEIIAIYGEPEDSLLTKISIGIYDRVNSEGVLQKPRVGVKWVTEVSDQTNKEYNKISTNNAWRNNGTHFFQPSPSLLPMTMRDSKSMIMCNPYSLFFSSLSHSPKVKAQMGGSFQFRYFKMENLENNEESNVDEDDSEFTNYMNPVDFNLQSININEVSTAESKKASDFDADSDFGLDVIPF